MKIKVYFDDNYLEAFKNMIYSAVISKKHQTELVLEVGLWGELGSNLSAESRSSILDFCRRLGVEVDFLPLRHFSDRLQSESYGERIPIDSLFARLSMLIESDSDFLYLDVDILLQPGWDDLLTLPSTDPSIAILGVQDLWLKHHGMTQDEKFGGFYINSGVFVCFYERWRDHALSQVLIRTVSKVDESEIHIRNSLYDQDILNIVSEKHKGLLDKTFNCQISPAQNGPSSDYYRLSANYHPKIVHFIGGVKPFYELGKTKFDIFNMADSNANLGYIDSVMHYYYLYYFFQNQRKIWEKNS